MSLMTMTRHHQNHRASFRPLRDDELVIQTADDIDIILGPDHGAEDLPAARHYRKAQSNPKVPMTQRSLDAAWANHQKDLAERYKLQQQWQAEDYSIKDLQLCWTKRQLTVALYVQLIGLVILTTGLLLSSTPVIVIGAVASVVLLPVIGRDGWRRAQMWMLEES